MSKPYVGMPGTWSPYTDCYPVTVIEVSKTGKTVTVQEDRATVVSGSVHDGSAKYQIERDENGPIMEFSLRKNGRWIAVGHDAKTGSRLTLGSARRYHNPHF